MKNDAYSMNIYSQNDGSVENFVGTMTANTMKECESLIVIELKSGYAVELIENDIDIPVCNYEGKKITTDIDGYCYLK